MAWSFEFAQSNSTTGYSGGGYFKTYAYPASTKQPNDTIIWGTDSRGWKWYIDTNPVEAHNSNRFSLIIRNVKNCIIFPISHNSIGGFDPTSNHLPIAQRIGYENGLKTVSSVDIAGYTWWNLYSLTDRRNLSQVAATRIDHDWDQYIVFPTEEMYKGKAYLFFCPTYGASGYLGTTDSWHNISSNDTDAVAINTLEAASIINFFLQINNGAFYKKLTRYDTLSNSTSTLAKNFIGNFNKYIHLPNHFVGMDININRLYESIVINYNGGMKTYGDVKSLIMSI